MQQNLGEMLQHFLLHSVNYFLAVFYERSLMQNLREAFLSQQATNGLDDKSSPKYFRCARHVQMFIIILEKCPF